MLHLVVSDIAEFENILMNGVLEHEAVGGTSTLFVLQRIKSTTFIPVWLVFYSGVNGSNGADCLQSNLSKFCLIHSRHLRLHE